LTVRQINEIADITKLRGQGYDGAANMSGSYTGVQTRIREVAPDARYVHCANHRLNLVLNDSVKHVDEVSRFFNTLEELYVFFSAITRWALLENDSSPTSLTLKRLCSTRWSSRNDALTALKQRFPDVMKVLCFLSLNGKNSDEVTRATALKRKLESFESVILITILSKILLPTDQVSKVLQAKATDLARVTDATENLLLEFRKLRDDWPAVLDEAKGIAASWQISPTFLDKRVHRVRRFHDELSEDSRLQSPERRFKTEVFLPILDCMMKQLEERFSSVGELGRGFACLSPQHILSFDDDALKASAARLTQLFPRDLSDSLADELLLLKSVFRKNLETASSVKQVLELLLVTFPEIASSYPEIITGCYIFLTLPMTVASAERSFSKLKLIKNHLRTSMVQDRLSSLALLSIERHRAKRMKLEKVIAYFADVKCRRKNF
jgi:hypothetical protein